MATPFFFPTLGTRLTLTDAWSFPLYNERRNHAVMKVLCGPEVLTACYAAPEAFLGTPAAEGFRVEGEIDDQNRCRLRAISYWLATPGCKWFKVATDYTDFPEVSEVKLPAGTVLVIDRIYVRKGSSDFDSLSFNIASCPDLRLVPKSKKGTFQGTPRFWAKLADINGKLNCTIEECAA